MKKSLLLVSVFSLFSFLNSSAQSTFATVQSILQSNCAGSGCHSGSGAISFDVDASATDLHTALVGSTPANTTASTKGNKLIDAGHPYNSFLFRTLAANGFDSYVTTDQAEEVHTTDVSSTLAPYEIEMVRQWITAGAQATGNHVNYSVLQDYYNNGGLPFIVRPPAPDPNEGFQVRMGPIFLAPLQEIEVIKKEYLRNNQVIKIKAMDGIMSDESHHMLLFKRTDDGSGARQGTRIVPGEGLPFGGATRLTGTWQNGGIFDLPENTAYFWNPNTILDFDYHIKNYSSTQVLPADFYLNVYYYDQPNAPIEMQSELVNEALLSLSQGQNTVTRTHIPSGNADRHIWVISSHTHKYGTGYKIWKRNADGSKGDLIYDGNYNYNYTFDQGFYDWEHPAVRTFDPLEPFSAQNGLIFETKWNVTGPCTSPIPFLGCVTFGLTTEDEMMLFTYHYTEQPLVSSAIANTLAPANMNVFPNPFNNDSKVSFTIEQPGNVTIEVYNLMGKKMETLVDDKFTSGEFTQTIGSTGTEYHSGIYIVTMTLNGEKVGVKKITKM